MNYGGKCAMCGISDSELLIASHIIPWAEDISKRGILENVMCLCILHDSLFEKGMITITDTYLIEFSEQFMKKSETSDTYSKIRQITFNQLRLPNQLPLPNKELLMIHRHKNSPLIP